MDPSDVLALLEESRDRHIRGLEAVLSDEFLPSGDLGRVLRSELQQSSICGTKDLCQINVDMERLGGFPSKSVMFDFESGVIHATRRIALYLGCQLLGSLLLVLPKVVGQIRETLYRSLLYEIRLKSKLGRMFVLVMQEFRFVLELKPSLVLDWSDEVLPEQLCQGVAERCFAGSPSTINDPHQQITGLYADQMIQFGRVIRLEVSSATFGMLQDLSLMIISKIGRSGVGGEGVSFQSPFRS